MCGVPGQRRSWYLCLVNRPPPHPRVSTEPPTGRRLGLRSATALVVASMVGTGVFTTTGYLIRDLGSASAVLAVWGVSGLLAGFGAQAYAELVVAFPRNGGEYQLLRELYHPAVGFTAGAVGFLAGFAAPIAATALLFEAYLGGLLPGLPARLPALGVILGATLLHARRVEQGAAIQDLATLGKVLLVGVLALGGLALGDLDRLGLAPYQGTGTPESAAGALPASAAPSLGAVAVALVYVSYAYSGWNAAAYVAGEVQAPGRNLPRALGLGTAAVTLLYLALNAAYLASAPAVELAGVDEIAQVAAQALLGPIGARVVSATVAFGLVSTVGALVMTGPRVLAAMGEDHHRLRVLAARNAGGAPGVALWLQGTTASVLALVSQIELIIAAVGFLLTVGALLTVVGVFRLRARARGGTEPGGVRTWGHPWTSLAFVGVAGWMVMHSLLTEPAVGLAGLGAVGLGLGLWRWASGGEGSPGSQ